MSTQELALRTEPDRPERILPKPSLASAIDTLATTAMKASCEDALHLHHRDSTTIEATAKVVAARHIPALPQIDGKSVAIHPCSETKGEYVVSFAFGGSDYLMLAALGDVCDKGRASIRGVSSDRAVLIIKRPETTPSDQKNALRKAALDLLIETGRHIRDQSGRMDAIFRQVENAVRIRLQVACDLEAKLEEICTGIRDGFPNR